MLNIENLFVEKKTIKDNIIMHVSDELHINQSQTKDIFSNKWEKVSNMPNNVDTFYKTQFEWFLSLYGFDNETDLSLFLSSKKVIVDAGCGLGYKAGWFAELAPHATVIGIDLSDAVYIAAETYKSHKNLFFT